MAVFLIPKRKPWKFALSWKISQDLVNIKQILMWAYIGRCRCSNYLCADSCRGYSSSQREENLVRRWYQVRYGALYDLSATGNLHGSFLFLIFVCSSLRDLSFVHCVFFLVLTDVLVVRNSTTDRNLRWMVSSYSLRHFFDRQTVIISEHF